MIPEEEIRQFAILLEETGFPELQHVLSKLEKADKEKYARLFLSIYNYNILTIIARHKVTLAEFLADSSNVEALPEDKTRIVFFVAKFAKTASLDVLNQAMAKEFGSDFVINKNYTIGKRVLTWQDITNRAAKIKRGHLNFFYLIVRNQVSNVMALYRIFKQDDPGKLKKIDQLAKEIFVRIERCMDNSPSTPKMKDALNMAKSFYKATGRLQLDIDKLDEETDFLGIANYITIVDLATITRLFLIKNNISVSNLEKAESALYQYLGQQEITDFLAYDLLRKGQPLKKISEE